MAAVGDMRSSNWRDAEGAKDGQADFFFRTRGRCSTLGGSPLSASASARPATLLVVVADQLRTAVDASQRVGRRVAHHRLALRGNLSGKGPQRLVVRTLGGAREQPGTSHADVGSQFCRTTAAYGGGGRRAHRTIDWRASQVGASQAVSPGHARPALATYGRYSLSAEKNVAEHVQVQAEFLKDKLEPRLAEARAGQRDVFFADAAHFVLGTFLCCLWCKMRLFVKAAAGRQRYNVLGAWNAVTNSLVAVTNTTVVSSETACELLRKIAAQSVGRPVTVLLDNARYQYCHVVQNLAQQLGIELLFLPSYSPNLDLIERLWKFVKKNALRGCY